MQTMLAVTPATVQKTIAPAITPKARSIRHKKSNFACDSCCQQVLTSPELSAVMPVAICSMSCESLLKKTNTK